MAEKQSILDLRMETRREAEKTKREITAKVEKVRSRGLKPGDLKELGYLSKADKAALNERSVVIDESPEHVHEANKRSGPFHKK